MPDYRLELVAVQDVASLTGLHITNIRRGPDALGIDVLFEFDGRPVGAQHTTFHSDEGHTLGVRGSPTRAKEEKIAGATDTAFGIHVTGDYRPALRVRIEEKIAKATGRNNDDLIKETWLIISANVSRWGAAGSTLIAASALRPADLNDLCHAQLAASPFECACLLLHGDSIVWGWDRPSGWRVLADPDSVARGQDRARTRDLIFNRIPEDFRQRMKRP